MKKMLLVFPHPDDESITSGGTIPKYVKAGWEVQLVCATRGEVGQRGDFGDLSDDELGAIRQKELEAAAKTLGISRIDFLGFKDGTLPNIHPGELEDKIYRKMTDYAPDIVITYEPGGISNHPDHMKLTVATTVAFQRYAKNLLFLPRIATLKGPKVKNLTRDFRKSFAECLEKETAPKLYYACMPASAVTYLQKLKILPIESFGKPWVGVPDKLVTTVIDIKRFRIVKIQALRHHKTQRDDFEKEIVLENNPVLIKEFFILRMQGVHEVYMANSDRVKDRL